MDKVTYAPLVLDGRSLSLDLDAADAAMAVFESCGKYGNGYSWEGVARSAMREDSPELAGKIEFDSEGSMFCVYAKEEAPLRRLGELMRDAATDPERLRRYLAAGDPDWFD
jgi:hypothetical protein